MPHKFIDGRATIEITEPYVEAMHRHGPDALERLRRFGLADRRESATTLLLAGAVPLAGMWLLDWSPSSVMLALLLNLLLNLHGDLFRILRMHGRLSEQQRLCHHDDFVWPVARALMNGERTMHAKFLPTIESLKETQCASLPFVFAILATISVSLAAWIIANDDELHAEPATLFFGTLPNLLLFAVAAVVQTFSGNRRWRDAASVRLGTAGWDAQAAFFAGLVGVGFFAKIAPDPIDPHRLATAVGIAVLAFALYRFAMAARLPGLAHWLERALAHRARYPHLHGREADVAPTRR